MAGTSTTANASGDSSSDGAGAAAETSPSSSRQSAPPRGPAEERLLGRFALKTKIRRVPGRRGTRVPLTVTFADARGKVVERLTVRRKAQRATVLRVRGVALAAAYRWRVTAGRRVIRRGAIAVPRRSGLGMSPGEILVARAA